VVRLYVEAEDWKEAFSLADQHPQFKEEIYVPYAKFLAESDRYCPHFSLHLSVRPSQSHGLVLLESSMSQYHTV
jgi:hypothetical protein